MKAVAVKPSLEIPHQAMFRGETYTFDPICEVPDEFADALVANQSRNFFLVKDTKEIDLKAYHFKDVFKNKSIADIVGTLSDEDKVKVYNLAKKLATKKPADAPPPAA